MEADHLPYHGTIFPMEPRYLLTRPSPWSMCGFAPRGVWPIRSGAPLCHELRCWQGVRQPSLRPSGVNKPLRGPDLRVGQVCVFFVSENVLENHVSLGRYPPCNRPWKWTMTCSVLGFGLRPGATPSTMRTWEGQVYVHHFEC